MNIRLILKSESSSSGCLDSVNSSIKEVSKVFLSSDSQSEQLSIIAEESKIHDLI